MNLYLVQDDERPMYVVASSFLEALSKWQAFIEKENDTDDLEPPKGKGVQFVCDRRELLL